jgi:uncharacterized protein (TIGR02453 family)
MTGFTGIPVAALDFYDDLEADNSRTWWLAHKAAYDACVRTPLIALVDALAEEFGEAKVYRPHRDVRFSKDKTPYKDHQGAFVATVEGVGFYVQIDASGLMTAAGWRPRGDQILRYREAVAGPNGEGLASLVGQAAAAGFTLDGERLATRPRGMPAGHPREELLRHKSLFVRRSWGAPGWLATAEAATRVRTDWRTLRPLVRWLADHVSGPPEADHPSHR